MLSINAIYAEDDDSTPYYPYPIQPPQQVEQPKANTTKKTPAKKKTTTKKTTKKKTPAKKSAPKKATAPVQTSLQKGIALMNEERYEAAKPYLLKAIQENRNDPNAWYWYGVYHEKTGGFYQAQYFYSKAVTIDPAFEPLSRVVYYPNDSEKTPLWDPKRPARVYPVETANNGVIIGRGNYPSAPNDPEIPKVPVYTPPEPGANPLDGDAWTPAVYVPPNPEEMPINEGTSPVYTPPNVQNIIAEEQSIRAENYTYKIPGYSNTYSDNNNYDAQIRADKPLYNPPEPGQVVSQNQRTVHQEIKEAKNIQPQRKETVQQKQPPAPRKIVKQPEKKKTATSKQVKKTKEQTKQQPQTQTQQQPTRVEPEHRPIQQAQPARPVEPVQPIEDEKPQPERRQQEYLPPVGQFSPDPGTISETAIPPVGQGNQY